MVLFLHRYDEWIKPEKIAGWGTRQTRNRTGGMGGVGKAQESNVKPTPKPIARPTAKPAGRRASKAAATAPVKEASTKPLLASNGTKNSLKRPCSPSTRSGSLSPSLGKSPKTSSGRGTSRTRSEKNSVSDMSNGVDEGINAILCLIPVILFSLLFSSTHSRLKKANDVRLFTVVFNLKL